MVGLLKLRCSKGAGIPNGHKIVISSSSQLTPYIESALIFQMNPVRKQATSRELKAFGSAFQNYIAITNVEKESLNILLTIRPPLQSTDFRRV